MKATEGQTKKGLRNANRSTSPAAASKPIKTESATLKKKVSSSSGKKKCLEQGSTSSKKTDVSVMKVASPKKAGGSITKAASLKISEARQPSPNKKDASCVQNKKLATGTNTAGLSAVISVPTPVKGKKTSVKQLSTPSTSTIKSSPTKKAGDKVSTTSSQPVKSSANKAEAKVSTTSSKRKQVKAEGPTSNKSSPVKTVEAKIEAVGEKHVTKQPKASAAVSEALKSSVIKKVVYDEPKASTSKKSSSDLTRSSPRKLEFKSTGSQKSSKNVKSSPTKTGGNLTVTSSSTLKEALSRPALSSLKIDTSRLQKSSTTEGESDVPISPTKMGVSRVPQSPSMKADMSILSGSSRLDLHEVDRPSASPKAIAQSVLDAEAGTSNDVTKKAPPSKTDILPRNIDLPEVSLDKMTKAELKEFIPNLLKMVMGRETVFHSRRSAKPEWWPEDMAWVNSHADWFSGRYWADHLKSVVANCYKHAGREHLLQQKYPSEDPSIQSAQLHTNHSCDDAESANTGSIPTSPVKINVLFPKDLFLPYSEELYICFFCEKEFICKERMRKHQKECDMRPPKLTPPTTVPVQPLNTPCTPPPSIGHKTPVTAISNPHWPRDSKNTILSSLGLVAKHSAARLSKRKPSSEVDCAILDTQEPMSPVLKTPTSLMSQLSKDESFSSRKRLSYTTSAEAMDSDEDSDCEVGTSKQPTVSKKLNLLNIPITSLLGQRIKKHVHVDTPYTVLTDSGSFCKTPVKNKFLDKLRKKPIVYPLIYKPRRIANLHKQNHLYTFNSVQKRVFRIKANYGLNVKSYEKLKKMKTLSVRLQRLSRKRMLEWMSRRDLDHQLRGKFKGLKPGRYYGPDYSEKCEFPAGPSLLAENIDRLLGLKKKSSRVHKSLSLSNCVSEDMEAEVSKQKLTLYRSLLYEMSVLKPTVVMEDISDHCLYEPKPTTSHKQDRQEENTVSVSPNRNNFSVLRTFLARDKVKPDMKVEPVDLAKKQENYEKLRSVLNSQEFSFNVPNTVPSMLNTSPVSSGWSTPRLDRHSSQLHRPPADDDIVTILSESSDTESLNSTCCSNCCATVHKNRPVKLNEGRDQFLQPLSVKIDEDNCLDTSYAFPSPVSTCSRSPSFSSPSSRLDDVLPGPSRVKSPSKLLPVTTSTPLTASSPKRVSRSRSLRSNSSCTDIDNNNSCSSAASDSPARRSTMESVGTIVCRESPTRKCKLVVDSQDSGSPSKKLKLSERLSLVSPVKADGTKLSQDKSGGLQSHCSRNATDSGSDKELVKPRAIITRRSSASSQKCLQSSSIKSVSTVVSNDTAVTAPLRRSHNVDSSVVSVKTSSAAKQGLLRQTRTSSIGQLTRSTRSRSLSSPTGSPVKFK